MKTINIEKLGKRYNAFAIAVFNIIIVLVVINLLLGFIYYRRDLKRQPGPLGTPDNYTQEKLQIVYPDMSWEGIQEMLKETWKEHASEYAPYVQRMNIARSDKYINVSPYGFRFIKDQGPWPPNEDDFNIFFFGGSTTWGYGVTDEETIPSYFQEQALNKKIKVYNFAQGAHYSIPEKILFEQLLLDGFVPDVAVFIDGTNDLGYGFGLVHEEDTDYTKSIKEFVAHDVSYNVVEKLKYFVKKFYLDIPMVRLANTISIRLGGKNFVQELKDKQQPEITDEHVRLTIERYLKNKKLTTAVAERFGVYPLFVWQPSPHYKYDLGYHLFLSEDELSNQHVVGYKLLDELRKKESTKNFLWLADIQEDRAEPFYVDSVHYTAAFHKEIAELIYEKLLNLRILNPIP